MDTCFKYFIDRELEVSADLIERFKGQKSKPGQKNPLEKSLIEIRAELVNAETRMKDMEEEMKEALETAEEKDKELTDAIIKIRAYEKGWTWLDLIKT